MAFLRNAWYMAAWSEDILPDKPFNRKLLDESIVFYRKSNGEVAALHNRCPHRFVPLHLGKIIGDTIQCGYHGLQFDCSGHCAVNPHSKKTPAAARVRAYEVVEQDHIIWIWMGEKEAARHDQLPDLSRLASARPTAGSKGYLWTECNYKLIADNVMDLSHADFLHSDSVGGAFSAARQNVSEQEGGVQIVWSTEAGSAPPLYDSFLPQPGQPVNFETRVFWRAPGIMNLDISVVPHDQPDSKGLQTHNAHIVTPETATSTHYFFWLTRQFDVDNAELNERRHTVMCNAFYNEDKPMLYEQQKAMGTDQLFELNPVLLPTDAGAVRARRRLERMIKDEADLAPEAGQPLAQTPT